MPNYTMYKNKRVDNTLDEKHMTSFLKNAQKAELKEIIKVIKKEYNKKQRPLKILDIGVGDVRIPKLLFGTKIWNQIKIYVGFDNSKMEVKKADEIIKKYKIKKTKIFYTDAVKLSRAKDILKHKYDIILCTYFTPGNFKPPEISLKNNQNGLIKKYPKSCLEPNQKFINIFKSAYELLETKGKIVLGSTYIDNNVNQKRQEDFYKKCGMTIITSKKDPFTATKEGFWSQRFTKKRFYDYFPWVTKNAIKFKPLDNHNFAQMVIISK